MDEVDLEVRFLETKVRGTDEVLCEVRVSENGMYGCQVHDSWHFSSWEELKTEYPTFSSLANQFLYSDNWRVIDDMQKVLTFSFIDGGEGLYPQDEYNIEVWSSQEDYELWNEHE